MKAIIFFLILAGGCWLLWGWLKKQSTPEKIQQDPLVHYTATLQNDVKKAESARDKANAAVQREAQSAQPAETPEQ
ncbi:MAG: hypothetical protein NTY77_12290 [Elusimicrobia bacterium]|nr:hypothetical protein [Elusimicrobiota bacterium]